MNVNVKRMNMRYNKNIGQLSFDPKLNEIFPESGYYNIEPVDADSKDIPVHTIVVKFIKITDDMLNMGIKTWGDIKKYRDLCGDSNKMLVAIKWRGNNGVLHAMHLTDEEIGKISFFKDLFGMSGTYKLIAVNESTEYP